MMSPLQRLYILLFAIILIGCNNHKPHPLLDKADSMYPVDIDASWNILNELLPDYDAMNSKDKARFGILLFKVYHKKNKNLPSVTYIDHAISYYRDCGNKNKLAESYYLKSWIHHSTRNYKDATNLLLKALELVQKGDDYVLLADINYLLSRLAGYVNELDKHKEYLRTAEVYCKKADYNDRLSQIYINWSWLHSKDYKDEEAIEYLYKALSLTTDSVNIGEIYTDLGKSYYFIEQRDSSLHYLKMAIEYPYISTNLSARYTHLGRAFLVFNELDSCKYYIHKALEYPIDIYFENYCYMILRDIALQTEDKRHTYYSQLYYQTQDSIRKVEAQPTVSILEEVHETHRINEKVKTHRSILSYTLFFFLIGTVGIVFHLFRKQRSKTREVKTYQTELAQIEEDIEKRNEHLIDEFYDELKSRRKQLTTQRSKANLLEREEIDRKTYKEILRYDNEQEFFIKMNGILNHLPEKLRNDYPDITYKEIIWCCLFMLRIPTNEIAIIMELKQTSLYKLKQRLGKKLGFDTMKELEGMLQDKVTSS